MGDGGVDAKGSVNQASGNVLHRRVEIHALLAISVLVTSVDCRALFCGYFVNDLSHVLFLS